MARDPKIVPVPEPANVRQADDPVGYVLKFYEAAGRDHDHRVQSARKFFELNGFTNLLDHPRLNPTRSSKGAQTRNREETTMTKAATKKATAKKAAAKTPAKKAAAKTPAKKAAAKTAKAAAKKAPVPRGDAIPANAQAAKNVGQLCRRMLLDGKSTDEILASANKRFPDNNYDGKSVSWHRWELRNKHGMKLPGDSK